MDLGAKVKIEIPSKMRFLTLPRVAHFVFNPISILILFNENKPYKMMVEVHNYNGGRIVYPVDLDKKTDTKYEGEVEKDMYVSPFLKRDGVYKFTLEYTYEKLFLSIFLYEDGVKTMMTTLTTTVKEFSAKTIRELFFKHTFLTIKVVTRTLWQSFKLYRLGLKFNSVTQKDQIRRD